MAVSQLRPQDVEHASFMLATEGYAFSHTATQVVEGVGCVAALGRVVRAVQLGPRLLHDHDPQPARIEYSL